MTIEKFSFSYLLLYTFLIINFNDSVDQAHSARFVFTFCILDLDLVILLQRRRLSVSSVKGMNYTIKVDVKECFKLKLKCVFDVEKSMVCRHIISTRRHTHFSNKREISMRYAMLACLCISCLSCQKTNTGRRRLRNLNIFSVCLDDVLSRSHTFFLHTFARSTCIKLEHCTQVEEEPGKYLF